MKKRRLKKAEQKVLDALAGEKKGSRMTRGEMNALKKSKTPPPVR